MITSVAVLAVHLSGNINLGELIVGVGTLALAGITWRLARTTGQSVAATQESAEAERASVEAMAMPYIIATPEDDSPRDEIYRVQPRDGGGGTLRLCLWNFGSGPGIVTNLRLVCRDEQLLVDLPRGIPLAAGSQFNANIDVVSWPTSPKAATLVVEYVHSNGRSYQTESDVTIEDNLLRCLTFRRSPVEEPTSG